MNNINIAFVTDNNYFLHMCVAIQSLIVNLKKDKILKIYILAVNLEADKKKYISSLYNNRNDIEINIISMNDKEIKNLMTKTHVSTSAFAKIYMCDLIPVNEIIYLDCDLIVNDDISKLWNEFKKDTKYIVKAVWNPFYDYDNFYLGLDKNEYTFNSGVMMLRLDLMRKNNSSQALYEFLCEYNHKTKLHDQAAFNAVFKDSWGHLDLRWNVQGNIFTNTYKDLSLTKKKYFEIYRNPGIIHFTTNSKPWHFRNNHPYKNLYIKYYEEIFNKINYEDINASSFLKKVKEYIIYKYLYLINKCL